MCPFCRGDVYFRTAKKIGRVICEHCWKDFGFKIENGYLTVLTIKELLKKLTV